MQIQQDMLETFNYSIFERLDQTLKFFKILYMYSAK